VLCISALGGCIYDAASPTLWYHNLTDDTVHVLISGAERPFERTVGSGSANGLEIDECLGTGIIVETEDGDVVGRVELPACPDMTLTINEDGSLDYTDT
jgi:hypothetical protein